MPQALYLEEAAFTAENKWQLHDTRYFIGLELKHPDFCPEHICMEKPFELHN